MKDLQHKHHLSFLLRLWRPEGTQNFDWRASLEIPETGVRVGFANLEQLFVYLMDLIEGQTTTRPETEKWETGNRNQEL